MEISVSSVVGAIVVVISISWILRLVNWVWLRPKKIEKFLRKQGLKGNPYRLLYGDLKDLSSMTKEAHSKPIGLSDDIVPRLLPLDHHIIQRYGKNNFNWFGPSPRVNLMDPQLIREVLSKYNDFQKPRTNPVSKMLIQGVAVMEGEEWAQRRKTMNPAFHVEKLRLMLPAFQLCCSMLVDKWKDSISAEGSCELDVWPSLQNMTGDVISRTAFGSNYEEGKVIFQLQTEQVGLLIKSMQAPYFPGKRFLPTKINKRMKEIQKTVNSVLKSIIHKREKAMKAGEAASNDLLGILLDSNMKEIENNNNVGMSRDDVINECKLFYFVGQETTSTLLVWTMVLLSQHQDWQDRARAEVLQVFGDKKPNYEGLNHMKVVTMILHEVLRLYAPVNVIYRAPVKETKLGELTLPAGTQVTIPILLVHHDREIWGDDAKQFNPQRFEEGTSKAAKSPSAFIPFGAGPRVCIGQNFALIEAKLAVAMMLQHFRFELSKSYMHAPWSYITLQPQHGCHVVLHKL